MVSTQSPPPTVRIPANRLAGLIPVTVALPTGLATVMWTGHVLLSLNYQLTLRRLFVDWSIAFVMVVLGAFGVALLAIGLRWLAFAVWPGWLGVIADANGLELCLGPFGRQRLAMRGIVALYRFERDVDDAVLSTEDFIAPDQERAHHLPIIEYAGRTEPVNRALSKYIVGDERTHRSLLASWTAHVRALNGVHESPAGNSD